MKRKAQAITPYPPKGETKVETGLVQTITPVKVETALVSGIQPKVVKLHNLRTGHIIDMSFKSATSLAAKFPKEYKLA